MAAASHAEYPGLHSLAGGKVPAVILLAFALSLPLLLSQGGMELAVTALLYVILALGLNVTVGYAGLLDLGYVAFYAVGAYTYGCLNYHYKVPFIICLPLGALAAAIAGLLLGSPVLRLRGDYLAIVTLGFAQMVWIVLKNWESVTNGVNGLIGIHRPSIFGYLAIKTRGVYLHVDDPEPLLKVHYLVPFYFIALTFAIAAAAATHRLEFSRMGRALMAIREDETAARAMGIHTSRMKLLAFVFGATWAGLAGVLFSAKIQFITPESFTFMESVLILCMVVLGGMGSIPGVIVGALVLYLLPELMREWFSPETAKWRILAFGTAMIVMMVFRPQGLIPSAAIRREVAARREED